jgi:phospholipase C
MRFRNVLLAASMVVGLVGVGASSPDRVAAAPGPNVPCVGSGAGHISHIVLIVQENAGFDEVKRSSPYLTSLARRCALFTHYQNLTHPSLPNYMAMTSGVPRPASDCDPTRKSCTTGRESIFSQTGRYWRVFAEDEPGTCVLHDHGLYAVRHTAAPYYTRARAACQRQDVPMGPIATGRFHRAVERGILPAFTMVIGNLDHDAHDTSAGAGDRWLAKLVPMILAGPQYHKGHTLVEITWDEGSQGLYTVAASPAIAPGTTVARTVNHYSLLATNERLLGLRRLAGARTARGFAGALGLD